MTSVVSRTSIDSSSTLTEYVHACLAAHDEHLFLAEVDGPSLTYGEASARVAALRRLLREEGIKAGDKVALLGGNSVNWCLTYLATVTAGAVTVPILPDFAANAVHNILAVSDSRMLFVTAALLEKVEGAILPNLERAFLLDDFSAVELGGGPELLRQVRDRVQRLTARASAFVAEHILGGGPSDHAPQPGDLAAIVYTSGTTGRSKGVMLTHGSLAANVLAAVEYVEISPADRFLALLPLAHTYQCTCGLLGPMSGGSSIHFLKAKPSPKVLLDAFAKVKPTIVFAVPLIIEKIYRSKVRPRIEASRLARGLCRVPFGRRFVYRKAVRSLLAAFGGGLRQMGFGGAALSSEVEQFMRLGRFPYFVGYGMTECSPLIAGSRLENTRMGSCGYAVRGAELRIADPVDADGVGEVEVRGPMVTQGYYRNAEATAALFTDDGWLRTGDLGLVDRDGFLHLKGRSKNVLVGPSGENVYPEEIEQLLNASPWVLESLVVLREGKLHALVVPDYDAVSAEVALASRDEGETRVRVEARFAALLREVNEKLPSYSKVSAFTLMDQEFEKTPTQKIKRYLYA